MPSIKFGIKFVIDGAGQTIAELLKIREAAKTIAEQSKGVNQLASSLGITEQSAAKFAAELSKSPGEINKLVTSLKAMQTAGVGADQQVLSLASKFGTTAEQAVKLQAAIAGNTVEQTRLALSLGTSLQTSQQFAASMGLSAGKATELVSRFRELGTGSITTAEKAAILNREFGITEKQFDTLNKTSVSVRDGMAGIAAAAGAVAASLGTIGTKGVQEFSQFDAQLRKIGVIGEASAAQVASIRSEIERLGTSTLKTPEEIAQLSIELAKIGFNADEVKDALGGIVLSSQATGEGLARTGQVIGNIVNQFSGNANQLKLTAKDTTAIADLITTTSNKTAAGTNDLGEALAYVGTEANQSNQSLKDTFLALGLLANAGIKGSSAGTGLAEALRRVKLASANASTELADLRSKGSQRAVAAFNEIDASVRGANGQLLTMPEILKNLKTGLANVKAQGDKDLITNALFGVQGGRTINVLLNATNEKVTEFSKALDDTSGVSAKAGRALSEGPAAGMKQLAATTSVALVKVGEILQGPFSLMISLSQKLVSTFVGLPGPVQAAVVGIAGFAGVLAAATAALAAYNFANGKKILDDTIAAALQIKKLVLDKLQLASTLSLTAVTNGQSFAVAAAVTAENFRNFALTKANALIVFQTIATKASALWTTAAAAATTAWAAVTTGSLLPALGGILVTLAPVILTLGAVIAAIAVLNAAFSRSPGAQFAKGVDENTEKLKKLREEADNPIRPKTDSTEVQGLLGWVEKLLQKVKEKGPIEGIQASFQSAGAAADEFGSQTEALTSTQRGNQLAILALGEQAKETGNTLNQGRAIIEKYGLATVDAGVKTRLGTKGIQEFNQVSEQQIKTIEASIAILEEQKKAATTNSQKEAIQSQITQLEGSKVALQKRAAALSGDTEALKTNTDRTKEAAEAQKGLEEAIKKIGDITKREAKGTTTADQSIEQVKATQAEAAAKKLSSEQLISLAEKTKEAIVKIRQEEISDIKKLLEDGEINEKQAIDKLQEIRSKSGSNPQAAKAASDAIIAIRKNETEAEIATIQAGIAEIDAARAGGKISEVKAEKATTALKQEEIRKRIKLAQEEVDLSSGTDRTKAIANLQKLNAELEKEAAESRKRIKSAEKQERDEKLATELAQIAAQVAKIESAKAAGRVNDVDAEKELTALKIEELGKQAEAARKNAEAEDDPKRREKLKAEADKLLADKEKAEAESSTRILNIKVKALEEENAKAIALIKAAETERSNEIQRGLNTGKTRQEQAQKDRLDNSRATIQKEIDAAQEAQSKLSELESQATNPKAREEFEKRKLEASAKTAAAIGKLLENEAAQQELTRQEIIRGIDREQTKRSQAVDLQIAQIKRLQAETAAKANTVELASQKEIAAIDRANRSLQIQGQLRAAQNGLEKARLDAQLALAERSGNPEQIAAVKSRIFQAEQAQAIATLAMLIKQEQFAQKRAEIEAKINELKAKQSILTAQQSVAEANLTAAKAKGEADAALARAQALPEGAARDKAITDAQQQQLLTAAQSAAQKAAALSGLETAKQSADLSIEATKQIKEQGAALLAMQTIQQQTLKLEQETAKARFDSAAAIEKQNAALAKQGAAKPDGGAAIPSGRRGGGVVTGGTAYIVGESEPELFIPGVSGTILNQRQIEANLTQLLQVRSVAGLSPVSLSMPSISVQNDSIAPLLKEIKLLRTLIATRSPVVNMPVTFNAPDTSEYDSVLRIQRSNLRGLL